MSEVPEIYLEVWRRRLRQEAKGYTAAHDDEHVDGSIADAAACYASPNAPLKLWPWRCPPPDQADRRERLVDAAALCIAEIERMDRVVGDEPDIIRTYDPTIPYVDRLRRE